MVYLRITIILLHKLIIIINILLDTHKYRITLQFNNIIFSLFFDPHYMKHVKNLVNDFRFFKIGMTNRVYIKFKNFNLVVFKIFKVVFAFILWIHLYDLSNFFMNTNFI